MAYHRSAVAQGVGVGRLNMADFDFHQAPAYCGVRKLYFSHPNGLFPLSSAKNEIFALLFVRESQQNKMPVVLFMMKS